MSGKGNPFIALRLSPHVMEVVHRVCRDEGIQTSELMRTALREYLAGRVSTENPGEILTTTTHNARALLRKPSRPVRLRKLLEEARDLLDDYAAWQSAMPESLEGCPTADRLEETVTTLEQVYDLLDAIEPPRGYGRD